MLTALAIVAGAVVASLALVGAWTVWIVVHAVIDDRRRYGGD